MQSACCTVCMIQTPCPQLLLQQCSHAVPSLKGLPMVPHAGTSISRGYYNSNLISIRVPPGISSSTLRPAILRVNSQQKNGSGTVSMYLASHSQQSCCLGFVPR